jgi:hypothetical protein
VYCILEAVLSQASRARRQSNPSYVILFQLVFARLSFKIYLLFWSTRDGVILWDSVDGIGVRNCVVGYHRLFFVTPIAPRPRSGVLADCVLAYSSYGKNGPRRVRMIRVFNAIGNLVVLVWMLTFLGSVGSIRCPVSSHIPDSFSNALAICE